MEKMSGKSLDLLEKNIDIIQKTFLEVMTEEEFNGKVERKIDFDKLRLLLGDDVSDREERYELRWNGKNDAIRFAQTPSNGTLRPDKESSKNWNDTENLYIEGDNLEVLKLLQKSYFGQIKMIYIDPPYNTGKDFVYKDDFRDNVKNYLEQTGQATMTNTESNGRYHTDWLNMMYPRLKIAKNLLSDDGVIFISIDDNEDGNLRKICDEIFGIDNYRNTIIFRRRIKSLNSQFAENGLYSMNIAFEYVVMYSRSNKFSMNAIRQKKENVTQKGRWDVFWSNADRPTMRYELLGFTPTSGQWRTTKEKAEIAVNNYKKYMNEYEDKMSIEEYSKKTGINKFIRRIANGQGKNGGVQHWVEPSDTMLRNTNWLDIEVSEIKKEIELPFDNPKSKKMIFELLKLVKLNKGDIILDFFSGSATTAHAVMQLNAEDGGNRKFIMVQLPEITPEKSEARKAGYENICEIGKERIRRAGDMIVNENKNKEGIEDLDIGFKVFKLDSSNIKEWDPDYENLEYSLFERQDIIKMGRTNEDLLYEIIIKMGIEPTVGIEEIKFGEKIIYNIGMGALLICLEDEITEDLVAEIPNHKSIIDEMDTKVVFKESGFRSDSAKMNAIQKLKQFGITDVRSV